MLRQVKIKDTEVAQKIATGGSLLRGMSRPGVLRSKNLIGGYYGFF